jgi:hypothetical protein
MDIFKSFTLDPKLIDKKKLDAGELAVCFATLKAWDKDMDWTEPGFFGNQEVQFIPVHDWDHVWMGKAVTHEEGNMAVADVKMNLGIQAAKDWHSAIKFDLETGNPIGEYSYGFKILEGGSESGEREGKRGRILRPREDGTPGCKIYEISPVLVGAGVRTRTLAAKTDGFRFSDQAEAALADVKELIARAKSLAELRAKEGRELSAENRERLAKVLDELDAAGSELRPLLVSEDDAVRGEARRIFLTRLRAGRA